MLKRVLTIALAALAVGAVIMMSGCAPASASYTSRDGIEITSYKDYRLIVFPNGLQCASSHYGVEVTGLSCNWEKFNKEQSSD